MDKDKETEAKGSRPRSLVIERRSGKLFQASRPVRLKVVLLLIVAALAIGAVLALGLKRVIVVESALHEDRVSSAQ